MYVRRIICHSAKNWTCALHCEASFIVPVIRVHLRQVIVQHIDGHGQLERTKAVLHHGGVIWHLSFFRLPYCSQTSQEVDGLLLRVYLGVHVCDLGD